MDASERARARRLLWVDSLGALLVGVGVLTFTGLVARLDNLPIEIVRASALANLAYGSFSGVLATLAARRGMAPRPGVRLLIIANLAWAVVCVAWLTRYGAQATPLGWMHIGGEGLVVTTLAVLEWRWVLRRM